MFINLHSVSLRGDISILRWQGLARSLPLVSIYQMFSCVSNKTLLTSQLYLKPKLESKVYQKEKEMFPFLPSRCIDRGTWGWQLAHCLNVPMQYGLLGGLQIAPRKPKSIFTSRWPTLLNSAIGVIAHPAQLKPSISLRGQHWIYPKFLHDPVRQAGKIPLQSRGRIHLWSRCFLLMWFILKNWHSFRMLGMRTLLITKTLYKNTT